MNQNGRLSSQFSKGQLKEGTSLTKLETVEESHKSKDDCDVNQETHRQKDEQTAPSGAIDSVLSKHLDGKKTVAGSFNPKTDLPNALQEEHMYISQLPLPKYDRDGIFKSYFAVGFDRSVDTTEGVKNYENNTLHHSKEELQKIRTQYSSSKDNSTREGELKGSRSVKLDSLMISSKKEARNLINSKLMTNQSANYHSSVNKSQTGSTKYGKLGFKHNEKDSILTNTIYDKLGSGQKNSVKDFEYLKFLNDTILKDDVLEQFMQRAEDFEQAAGPLSTAALKSQKKTPKEKPSINEIVKEYAQKNPHRFYTVTRFESVIKRNSTAKRSRKNRTDSQQPHLSSSQQDPKHKFKTNNDMSSPSRRNDYSDALKSNLHRSRKSTLDHPAETYADGVKSFKNSRTTMCNHASRESVRKIDTSRKRLESAKSIRSGKSLVSGKSQKSTAKDRRRGRNLIEMQTIEQRKELDVVHENEQKSKKQGSNQVLKNHRALSQVIANRMNTERQREKQRRQKATSQGKFANLGPVLLQKKVKQALDTCKDFTEDEEFKQSARNSKCVLKKQHINSQSPSPRKKSQPVARKVMLMSQNQNKGNNHKNQDLLLRKLHKDLSKHDDKQSPIYKSPLRMIKGPKMSTDFNHSGGQGDNEELKLTYRLNQAVDDLIKMGKRYKEKSVAIAKQIGGVPGLTSLQQSLGTVGSKKRLTSNGTLNVRQSQQSGESLPQPGTVISSACSQIDEVCRENRIYPHSKENKLISTDSVQQESIVQQQSVPDLEQALINQINHDLSPGAYQHDSPSIKKKMIKQIDSATFGRHTLESGYKTSQDNMNTFHKSISNSSYNTIQKKDHRRCVSIDQNQQDPKARFSGFDKAVVLASSIERESDQMEVLGSKELMESAGESKWRQRNRNQMQKSLKRSNEGNRNSQMMATIKIATNLCKKGMADLRANNNASSITKMKLWVGEMKQKESQQSKQSLYERQNTNKGSKQSHSMPTYADQFSSAMSIRSIKNEKETPLPDKKSVSVSPRPSVINAVSVDKLNQSYKDVNKLHSGEPKIDGVEDQYQLQTEGVQIMVNCRKSDASNTLRSTMKSNKSVKSSLASSAEPIGLKSSSKINTTVSSVPKLHLKKNSVSSNKAESKRPFDKTPVIMNISSTQNKTATGFRSPKPTKVPVESVLKQKRYEAVGELKPIKLSPVGKHKLNVKPQNPYVNLQRVDKSKSGKSTNRNHKYNTDAGKQSTLGKIQQQPASTQLPKNIKGQSAISKKPAKVSDCISGPTSAGTASQMGDQAFQNNRVRSFTHEMNQASRGGTFFPSTSLGCRTEDGKMLQQMQKHQEQTVPKTAPENQVNLPSAGTPQQISARKHITKEVLNNLHEVPRNHFSSVLKQYLIQNKDTLGQESFSKNNTGRQTNETHCNQILIESSNWQREEGHDRSRSNDQSVKKMSMNFKPQKIIQDSQLLLQEGLIRNSQDLHRIYGPVSGTTSSYTRSPEHKGPQALVAPVPAPKPSGGSVLGNIIGSKQISDSAAQQIKQLKNAYKPLFKDRPKSILQQMGRQTTFGEIEDTRIRQSAEREVRIPASYKKPIGKLSTTPSGTKSLQNTKKLAGVESHSPNSFGNRSLAAKLKNQTAKNTIMQQQPVASTRDQNFKFAPPFNQHSSVEDPLNPHFFEKRANSGIMVHRNNNHPIKQAVAKTLAAVGSGPLNSSSKVQYNPPNTRKQSYNYTSSQRHVKKTPLKRFKQVDKQMPPKQLQKITENVTPQSKSYVSDLGGGEVSAMKTHDLIKQSELKIEEQRLEWEKPDISKKIEMSSIMALNQGETPSKQESSIERKQITGVYQPSQALQQAREAAMRALKGQ